MLGGNSRRAGPRQVLDGSGLSVARVQVGPLVVVEGALRDNLSTKALDGCSHHAALVEHAIVQEKVAGSSSATSNKKLASPPELVQLLAHTLYNDQSSHDVEIQVLTGAYRDSCLVRLFGLSGYFSGFLDPSTWNIWSSNVTTLSLQPQRTNFLRKHGLRGHLPETLLRLDTVLV
ncbi:hypothetical protein MRX96_004506 [Rhipicephalus microplus]